MLKEIVCDSFMANGKPRGTIRFNKGLNTILGGHAAENSIGKSTFLLIIDFCFGGDTYGKTDIYNYVGDHTICFMFEFDDGKHYYSRDISDLRHVTSCNEKYEAIEVISIKAFREQLMKGYKINLPGISFRNIVSRFFRVAGKNNDTVINPLHGGSPNTSDAITALEKIFNMYSILDELKENLEKAKKKKATYTSARKMELVPNDIRTKAQYDKNEKQIHKLIEKKNTLIKDIDTKSLEMEMQRNDVASSTAAQLRSMKRQYNKLISQYRLVTKNREDKFVATEEDLQKLLRFFPNADIKHIEELEKFHRKMSSILDSELAQESENLQTLIKDITLEIQRLAEKLNKLQTPLYVSKSFLDEYLEIGTNIANLQSQNDAFKQVQELKENAVKTEECLAETEMQVLCKIEAMLNSQMLRYNDFIYDKQREAPTIRFESGKKYCFTTPRDGGTGTAYKSLIILDMSVLNLTPLPAIAHDSSIFKNIGDEPIDKIMELYMQSEKQIFIAFDKEQSYSKRISDIINNTAVLRLKPNGEELFGWCWAEK